MVANGYSESGISSDKSDVELDELEKLVQDASEELERNDFLKFKEACKVAAHQLKVSTLVLPDSLSPNKKSISEVQICKTSDEVIAQRTTNRTRAASRYRTKAMWPPTYMYLENSYVILQSNVVRCSPFDEDFFIKTVQQAMSIAQPKFKDEEDCVYQLLIDTKDAAACHTVSEFRKWYQKCLKAVYSLDRNNNNDDDGQNQTICSSTCFKSMGAPVDFPVWTVHDEFQGKRAMLEHGSDYCSIAKAFESKKMRSCNEVYQLAKHLQPFCNNQDTRVNHRTLQQRQMFFEKRNGFKVLPPFEISFYVPCNHEGKSCDETCPCYLGKNYCEEFCGCSRACENRFTGCACTSRCNTNLCPCFVAHRECHAQLCKKHGKTEALLCCNLNLRHHPKKELEVKVSTVKRIGFGLFAKQAIEKNEYIIEYTGELITHREAESRSQYYSQIKKIYLFGLCSEYSIDAFFIGNESRFINHSDTPNCEVKILTASGEKSVIFFAKKRILPGEELFFMYNYNNEQKQMYFEAQQKRISEKCQK